jgi:hypothetical protein
MDLTAQVEENPMAPYCSACKKALRDHWRRRPCLEGHEVMFFLLDLFDDKE